MRITSTVRRTSTVAALGAVAAVLGMSGLTGVAGASPAHAGATVSSSTAVIRGAHFSPDTPGVDVYLTAFSGHRQSIWLHDVGYGDVSSYERIKPGLYVVSMRAHGAPATSAAALSWTVDARRGAAYTVAAVGMNKDLRGIVLHDEVSTPRSANGLVRVVQAASRAPHAQLVAQPDHIVAQDAAFASFTKYASLPAGTWTLTAKQVPGSLSTQSRISIAASSVNTVVVLDAKSGGIQLRVVHDNAGTASVPQGSIDAGGGGTAPAAHDTHDTFLFGGFAAALLVLAFAGLGYRRFGAARV